MADMAELCNRFAPWLPSPESETVAQYRYYDVPLCGVFRQGDREFLYMCLDGASETLSLWWYVALSLDQRKALEAAEGDEFEALIHHMQFHGWTRLALATTNLGIVDYQDVEDTGEDEASGFIAALDALRERLHELSEDADRLAVPV